MEERNLAARSGPKRRSREQDGAARLRVSSRRKFSLGARVRSLVSTTSSAIVMELLLSRDIESSPGRRTEVSVLIAKGPDKPASSGQEVPAAGLSKDRQQLSNMMSMACLQSPVYNY